MGDGARTVIDVTDLRKEYGATVAVDGISFEVYADEIFGLLGPNGAGKTVTVELLQGLRTPTSGTATILGHDVRADQYELTERIGVVPQSFHTFERLTVRENVALLADMYADPLPVDAVLADLDLQGMADRPFHSLSGGYQRRTGIAMALVSDPEVLFLDEPTTGLDPAARRATWEQIESLADRGTTIVLTSHYMDEIEFLADRVGLLVDGRLVALDTVSALIDRFAGEVRIVVRFAADRDDSTARRIEAILAETTRDHYWQGDDELVGVFDDRQVAQETFSELHDSGGARAIDLTSAGMEDVFLELAGGLLDERGELA